MRAPLAPHVFPANIESNYRLRTNLAATCCSALINSWKPASVPRCWSQPPHGLVKAPSHRCPAQPSRPVLRDDGPSRVIASPALADFCITRSRLDSSRVGTVWNGKLLNSRSLFWRIPALELLPESWMRL